MSGHLFGVGVGPGDPELVTVKAVRILKAADVVCVPRAHGRGDSYALRTIRGYLRRSGQELWTFPFPTQDPGADAAWETAATEVVGALREGKDVAFATEGDPLLYGSFAYVLEAIKVAAPEVPIDVVPGVTSILAAAARAQTPLVAHHERLAVLPGSYGLEHLEEDLEAALRFADTVVLMKLTAEALPVLAGLEARGLVRKVVYAEKVGMPEEKIITSITGLAAHRAPYFSLVILWASRNGVKSPEPRSPAQKINTLK